MDSLPQELIDQILDCVIELSVANGVYKEYYHGKMSAILRGVYSRFRDAKPVRYAWGRHLIAQNHISE